jgi:hypothetical protein
MLQSAFDLIPEAQLSRWRSSSHLPTATEPRHLPPPPRQLPCPNPTEQILTLVLILRIKLNQRIFLALLGHIASSLVPRYPLNNTPGLQNVLPDFIPLRFFLSFYVLPPQYSAAQPTANVADGVCAGDEVARYGRVREGVGNVALCPLGAV